MSSSSTSIDIVGEDDVEPIHWGLMAGSTFTLINSAVSASLLTLPFAFKNAGIVQGIILIVLLGSLARFIDWRLVRYGRRFKATSYSIMIANALGDRVGIFLSALVAISLFVGLVGLLILVGDLVTPIMQYWFGAESILGNRTALTILVSMLFIIPLGSLPSVNMLQYSSVLTVVSLLFMTVSVIIRCVQKVGNQSPAIENHPIVLWNWSWDIVKAFPIIWYNSGFIFQAIPVLAQRPAQFTRQRNAVIMFIVTLVVSGLMIALGVPGYLTFYDRSNGNILTNYSIDDPLIGICRALVTVVVVCSYPLFNMPLRDSLFYLQSQFLAFRAGKPIATNNLDCALAKREDFSSPHPILDLDSDGPSITPLSITSVDSGSSSSDEATTSTDAEMVRLDLDASVAHSAGFSEAEGAQDPSLYIHSGSTPTPAVALDIHSSVQSPESSHAPDFQRPDFTSLDLNSPSPSDAVMTEEYSTVGKETIYATWTKGFIQTFVCWVLAFTLAYIIPDITVVIGFVGSTFSPVYYFALPGMVAVSLPEGRKWTRMGGYFLFSLCALFLISSIATYSLPKNIVYPPLPSHQNTAN